MRSGDKGSGANLACVQLPVCAPLPIGVLLAAAAFAAAAFAAAAFAAAAFAAAAFAAAAFAAAAFAAAAFAAAAFAAALARSLPDRLTAPDEEGGGTIIAKAAGAADVADGTPSSPSARPSRSIASDTIATNPGRVARIERATLTA